VIGVPAGDQVTVAPNIDTNPVTQTTAPPVQTTTVPTQTAAPQQQKTTTSESAAPPIAQTATEQVPIAPPEPTTSTTDERSRLGGIFHRGGRGKALVDSEEFRSGAFQKGFIGNYGDMVADPNENVEWAWVAPGVKLSDHKIRIGSFRNLTSATNPALAKNLEVALQSDINELTEDATGSLLTTEGVIYWAESSQSKKRGVGVEMVFKDPSGRIVAKIRHHAIKRSLEAGAEEVEGNVYDFVKDQE
jgi:hypothetical protein